MGKYVGIGTHPRKAILWHVTEFMSDAHISRIRTSLRRRLNNTAVQSVHSSMDSQQTLLQDKAAQTGKGQVRPTVGAHWAGKTD